MMSLEYLIVLLLNLSLCRKYSQMAISASQFLKSLMPDTPQAVLILCSLYVFIHLSGQSLSGVVAALYISCLWHQPQ